MRGLAQLLAGLQRVPARREVTRLDLAERRELGAAVLRHLVRAAAHHARLRAARVEDAPGGRVDRGRHVAGENVLAEALHAKATAVECAEHVVHQAVQLFGGTGYMHGTEVERHYRDARILGIGGGATEVLNDLNARLLGFTP